MLSILAGEWRGHRLEAPDHPDLRPTLGRVKAAIFSILEAIEWKRSGSPDFSGWRCLDLFAGVGGLGLEMLSRGADHCVFVEKQRKHAKILERNIDSLAAGERTTLLVEDALQFGWESQGPFQLILIDPPYKNSILPELLGRLANSVALPVGGIVLFEHDPKSQLPEVPGLRVHSTRVLGPAGITVLMRE